ncbi:MAG: glucose-1-phosphate thymidylyltransferase [Euryarchaeota archaeon]|nr:glucose-1-phosphate thymidylyltransferase [Euryarchaeota archaeon]
MEWPTSVTTSALFADFPQTVFNLSGQPAWELLNPDHPSGIKQILSKKLKQLGSKHPTDVLYVTIDEAKGPVHVEEGATIEPHVHLIGPCLIESGATVRAHAYVRENTWMMQKSLLGHSSESKHALFLPGAKAPHFNYVGDSVLGSNVNLGAGVKLSNLRNDGAVVAIWIDDERHSTGIRKFGAIIGDGTQLGCNTVTNPGSVLGQNCMVHPNTTVSGLHAPSSVLR